MDLRKKSKEKKVNRMEDGCFAYVLGWDEFNGFFFSFFQRQIVTLVPLVVKSWWNDSRNQIMSYDGDVMAIARHC